MNKDQSRHLPFLQNVKLLKYGILTNHFAIFPNLLWKYAHIFFIVKDCLESIFNDCN